MRPPAPCLGPEDGTKVASTRPRPLCPRCNNVPGEAGFLVELVELTFLQSAWWKVLLQCSQDLWLPAASLQNLLCCRNSEGQRQKSTLVKAAVWRQEFVSAPVFPPEVAWQHAPVPQLVQTPLVVISPAPPLSQRRQGTCSSTHLTRPPEHLLPPIQRPLGCCIA